MQRKFVISVISCLLLSITIFVLLHHVVSDTLEESMEVVSSTYVQDMGDTLVNVFDTNMRLRMDEVRGASLTVKKVDDTVRMQLVYLLRQYGFTHSAVVSDEQFTMLYGNQISPVNGEKFYTQLKSGKESMSLGVERDGEFVILFAMPANMEDYYGLVAALPVSYLDTVLKGGESGITSYAVMNEDGRMVYNAVDVVSRDVMDRISTGESFIYERDTWHGRIRESYVKLPYAKWYLIISMDRRFFDGFEHNILVRCIVMFIFGTICFSVALGFTFSVLYKILKQQMLAVKAASDAKTVFLTNMSHDVRTPMNGILGTAAIAFKHTDDVDKIRECLNTITKSAGYMLGLFDNMLDIASIEGGRVTVKSEPFWLGKAMRSVVETVRFVAEEKGISVTLLMGDIEHEYVYGDIQKLSQVLVHLVNNAIKYTDVGGSVTLTVSQKDGVTYCEVKDNGCGIGEEALPHIFESFYREDTLRVGAENGAGLGLSIAKNIVDELGGEIIVESERGVGSTFTVKLKLDYAGYHYTGTDVVFTKLEDMKKVLHEYGCDTVKSQKEATVIITKSDTVRGKKVIQLDNLRQPVFFSDILALMSIAKVVPEEEFKLEGARILIVEDNELNYEILNDILIDEGLITDWAENGQIAVDKFKESDIDYYQRIIMDIRMPVMDGYEATRAIRALDRDDAETVPIIALSADAYESAIQKCLEAGMNGYASKPVNVDVILDLLKKGGS